MAAHDVADFLRRLRCSPYSADSDGDLIARFLTNDQAAFDAIVKRHGPMVLAACRRMLPHPQDAEDAFQATFLVLSQKAASISGPEKLAGWLHGVARLTAAHARGERAKQGAKQRQVAEMPESAAPRDDPAIVNEDREVRLVLDTELSRLPDHYRAVLLLCDLEGMTQAEAAGRLGCCEKTLRTHLHRARELLRVGLSARGITAPVVALSAGALVAQRADAQVVIGATVRIALRIAAGEAVSKVMSPQVADLVSASASMVGRRITKRWLALCAALLVAAGGAAGSMGLSEKPGTEPPVLRNDVNAPQRQLEDLRQRRLRMLQEEIVPRLVKVLESQRWKVGRPGEPYVDAIFARVQVDCGRESLAEVSFQNFSAVYCWDFDKFELWREDVSGDIYQPDGIYTPRELGWRPICSANSYTRSRYEGPEEYRAIAEMFRSLRSCDPTLTSLGWPDQGDINDILLPYDGKSNHVTVLKTKKPEWHSPEDRELDPPQPYFPRGSP